MDRDEKRKEAEKLYGEKCLSCATIAEQLSVFEPFRFRLAGLEDEPVQSRLVHGEHLLLAAKGVNSIYTLFVVWETCKCSSDISKPQYFANILCDKPGIIINQYRADGVILEGERR
jgi:hypothetical protein